MKKIMLIDDDQIFNLITEKVIRLDLPHTEIIAVTSAVDALAYFKEHNNNPEALPDVIFLDINLPVLNGFEFLDIFEHLYFSLAHKIRIFVLTTSMDPRDHIRARRYNVIEKYVEKPLTRALFASIRQPVD